MTGNLAETCVILDQGIKVSGGFLESCFIHRLDRSILSGSLLISSGGTLTGQQILRDSGIFRG